MIYAFSLFVALQALDAWLTITVIRQGGRELNPVVAWAMRRAGVVIGLAVVKMLYIALVLLLLPLLTAQMLWWICGAYALLVIWNLTQLR